MDLPLRLLLSVITGGLISWFWPWHSDTGHLLLVVVAFVFGIFWGLI